MNPDHKKLLRVNNFYLMNHLDIENEPNLLTILINFCILSQKHVDEINSQILRIKKVEKFLSILPKRGSKAFDKFMEALVLSNQEYIADKLNMCLGVPFNIIPNSSVDVSDYLIDNRKLNVAKKSILLMNNYNFGKEDANRVGSEKDVENLESFFVEAGYKLFDDNSYKDLKADEMITLIKKFSSYIVEKSINYAVIIIMSHGKNKRISGVDEEFVDLQHIYKILSYKTENIFKLIIFSCCRGETAALSPEGSQSDYMSVYDKIQEDRLDDYVWQFGNYPPKHAIVLYSTQENYQSHREISGTIFIQAMLSIFKKYYKEKPVRDMAMKIREEMKILYPKYDQWPDIKENYFNNFFL